MSAPKGFVTQLAECKEDRKKLRKKITKLEVERKELFKVIRNTADSLSNGDLDRLQTDVFRIVRQLDDLLMAARNDRVYDDS